MRWPVSRQTPVVILNEPQLAENIGAVARVMANFGLSELRLVRPRDGWPQERAWASASGASWPLDGAKVYQRLEAAVADLRLTLATTARPRETQLPVMTPREAAGALKEGVGQGWNVGLLFGGERAGLETLDIALTQGIVTVPVDTRFQSLNLAQAVAICAYEWRLALDAGRLLSSAGEATLDDPQPARGAGPGAVHRPGGAHLPRRDHRPGQRARPGAGEAGGAQDRREDGRVLTIEAALARRADLRPR